jgi:hypothetical protein
MAIKFSMQELTWEEIGLTTFKDGFMEASFTIALHFGIFSIVRSLDQILIFVLLLQRLNEFINRDLT